MSFDIEVSTYTISKVVTFDIEHLRYRYTIIWNPDHLDKNGQNGTYVSEHATNMYVHVLTVTYKPEHV